MTYSRKDVLKEIIRNHIVLILSVILGVLFLLQLFFISIMSESNENRDTDATEKYLTQKYKHEFILSNWKDKPSADVSYEFSVYPVGHEDIIFTVKYYPDGPIRHPFIPIAEPIGYVDNFSKTVKEWVIKHNDMTPLVINDAKEIDETVDKVYKLLSKINEQFAVFNISTQYEYVVTWEVIIKGKNTYYVDFGARNEKSTIRDLLVEVYSSK